MPPDDKEANERDHHPPHLEAEGVDEARDVREEFAAMMRKTPRDLEAERGFIRAKIETVKKHPGLTDDEKKTAIEALEAMLP